MNRKFDHWTPRYFLAKSKVNAYHLLHPSLPWLTADANRILDIWLKPGMKGLEFGSGRSTIWFASRLFRLTSVEHNPQWHKRVSLMLAAEGVKNTEYLLRERMESDGLEGETSSYVSVLDTIAAETLDFILVDGAYRATCALKSISKLTPGGILVIDNANLYLPCESHSPNSRTEQTGPSSALWAEFIERTHGWILVWTSNGVWDTAVFHQS
jgi:hypothetical protein